jgi:hypothetical protein
VSETDDGDSGPAGEMPHQTEATSVWAQLCAELAAEFPTVDKAVILEEVARSRSATDLFGLPRAERFPATAAMARNNLNLLINGGDLARLDPENHSPRNSPA